MKAGIVNFIPYSTQTSTLNQGRLDSLIADTLQKDGQAQRANNEFHKKLVGSALIRLYWVYSTSKPDKLRTTLQENDEWGFLGNKQLSEQKRAECDKAVIEVVLNFDGTDPIKAPYLPAQNEIATIKNIQDQCDKHKVYINSPNKHDRGGPTP